MTIKTLQNSTYQKLDASYKIIDTCHVIKELIENSIDAASTIIGM